jgi:methionine aminopeptidase
VTVTGSIKFELNAGASLREVCSFVEDEIRRLGARHAFPVQSSRNELAAHYCASPEDGRAGPAIAGWTSASRRQLRESSRP